MERARTKWAGFGTIEILVAVFLIMGITAFGVVIASNKTDTIRLSAATNTQAAPTSAWNTYNDTGYAVASGISMKYPPDWEINIPGVKAIGNTTNPTAVINERIIYLPSSETPKEEWNTCAAEVSADACGAAPGDTTISSSESTISGLAAYTATMQNSHGTYHVTVMQGNKPTSYGTPYVEFTITSNDPAALNAFAAVMTSATLPN